MTFWDSSALVPLFVDQPASRAVRPIARDREPMGFWWGSVMECWSAFARLRREGVIDREREAETRRRLQAFLAHCIEIAPSEKVRAQAGILLGRHDLRAGDALQLGGALVYFQRPPAGEFVTFDGRLREASRLEGLTPLP